MIYPIILTLHSFLRWVVLVLAVVTVVRAFSGWFGRKEWTGLDNRLGIFFSSSMDLQLLLGLILYFLLSPITRGTFQNFGAAMSNAMARFWAIEHILLMVVAVVLVHVGWALSKRAAADTSKHRRVAIFFGLAMLAVLLAIPWPFLPYGRPLLRLPGLM